MPSWESTLLEEMLFVTTIARRRERQRTQEKENKKLTGDNWVTGDNKDGEGAPNKQQTNLDDVGRNCLLGGSDDGLLDGSDGLLHSDLNNGRGLDISLGGGRGSNSVDNGLRSSGLDHGRGGSSLNHNTGNGEA